MNAVELVSVSGEPRVSSEMIAEHANVEHRAVLQLLGQYEADFADFGTSAFQMRKSGGRPTRVAMLNEDQATLLLTYLKNTEQVRGFKKALVKAFRGARSTTPALTEDEIVHQALQITARKVEQLEAKVAELEPKADLADNYLTAKPNGRLLREVAKAMGMRERDLRGFLIEERMIFTRQSLCGNVVYDFKAEFRPHFEARETVVNHSWGTCQHYTLYITPQGVGLIRKRVADRQAAIAAVAS